ncbi:MAG TPA: glycosyltransferase, partial [Trebonia sp.]|nr:glycosyltransferase [Trebonia sp.]
MELSSCYRPIPAPPERRLRIAFAMPPWFDVPPKGYGGIESMAASLADALVGRGHTVVIVGPGRNGTRAHYRQTYPVAPSERIGHPVPEVLHAAWSNDILAGLDVDVVHDHSLAGPLTAPRRAAPTVVTAHCPCIGDMGAYYGIICRDTALVAISECQRQLSPGLRWASTVHNAINTADYAWRTDKDDFVLFLGRMSHFKGAHLAIDAAREAGRPIVLAGKLSEAHEKDYFEHYIKPRLGPDAVYVGEVDMAGK